MGAQILGTVTFTKNPGWMTIIRPDRYSSYVLTYSSVGFFSWGSSIIGKEVLLKWNAMPTAQYEDIQDLWESDTEVIFDPKDDEGNIYDVEILDFQGEYCVGISAAGGPTYTIRKNVTLKLLILDFANRIDIFVSEGLVISENIIMDRVKKSILERLIIAESANITMGNIKTSTLEGLVITELANITIA